MATIYGTANNDLIRGYDFKTDGLEDNIFGMEGDDTIYGGRGTDSISGGDGNDVLNGETGDDSLHGDAGNDRIYGVSGEDFIWGGQGNDRLFGGADKDRLYGEDGNDSLSGGTGNDDIFGGSGKDKLYGDEGDDWLYGGAGADYIDGGDGFDTVVFEQLYGNSPTLMDFRINSFDGDAAGDNYVNVERFVVYDSIVTIFGNSNDEVFEALRAGSVIYGGDGQDTLIGYGLHGEGGNDYLAPSNSSHAYGGDGNDWFGDTSSTFQYGEAGNDTFYDRYGSDFIDGGDGDDYIEQVYAVAASGEDESYTGGAGNDVIRITRDGFVDGGSGTDRLILYFNGVLFPTSLTTLDVRKDNHVTKQISDVAFVNFEHYNIFVTNGNFKIYLGSGDDVFLGGARSTDICHGGGGDDVLDGSSGLSRLYGEAGNDLLQVRGWSPPDQQYRGVMSGGAGDDLLIYLNDGIGHYDVSGGTGADTFAFAGILIGAPAEISDFVPGVDKLAYWIRNNAYGHLFPGIYSYETTIETIVTIDDSQTLAFTVEYEGYVDHEFTYNRQTGAFYIDLAGAYMDPVHFATLVGAPQFSVQDFRIMELTY